MKKLLVSGFILSLFAFTVISCGGGGNQENQQSQEGYSEYETAEPNKNQQSGNPEDLIAQGKALVDQSDCKTCHHQTNKLIGPAHAEVAEKYDFTQANVTYLAGKIIEGGSGVWGEIPMTPHPGISQADAEKMAMYVLSLDGEEPKLQ